jgi:hypothetical protein
MNSSDALEEKTPSLSFLRKQESNKGDYPMIMACSHRKVYSRMLTRTTHLCTITEHRFRRTLVCWIPEQVGEDSEGE